MALRAYRVAVLACALLFVALTTAEAARPNYARSVSRQGVNDPRYAALVMDPQTGEVFHQKNASAIRHPASLTKMMTLYLLFEQMKAGKITKSTTMRASKLAASQPQTNISLRPGDTLSADLAIKALVVRSANDVAVVVAEHISGSVWNFAALATKRAKELGMSKTVFRNPNGLPNAEQVTTAFDMAKLGVALKRDFPEYYPYFAVRQFSRKGVTYYTHNRVMTGYAGVDGIKTGFINASGFNVVSSVERGGRRLIGVVLGGTTAGWRDERMKALLSQGYQTLASRGNRASTKLYADNLPRPRGDTQAIAAAKAKSTAPVQASAAVSADRGIVQAKLDAPGTAIVPENAPFKLASSSELTYREESANTETNELGWGIQVGAFTEKEQAQKAVVTAVKLAPAALAAHKPAIIDAGVSGGKVHRARIENLSESQARNACEALINRNAPCFIYKAREEKL